MIGIVRHDQAVEKSATGLSARAPTSADSPLSDGFLSTHGTAVYLWRSLLSVVSGLYIEAELPELDLGFEVKLFFFGGL